MKILIIGGAGFLGANLVRRCLAEPGVELTVMDSLDPHLRASLKHLRPVWDRLKFVRADLRDEFHLSEIIYGQDLIFQCAAQTSHPLSIQHPLLDTEINCLGNLKLLEAVRLVNPGATVVYTSSSTVIGKAVNHVIDEDHWERPMDIYSANKSVVEKYYRLYRTLHDLNTVVLRFANLFGPYGKGYPEFGFLNYFLDLAWQNKEITVYGEGGQTRNVMFVQDACEALWRAAQTPTLRGEVYFATGDEHLTVRTIAETMVRVLGRGQIKQIEWPEMRRRFEIEDVRFSSARFRELTGWRPRFTLASGLEETKRLLAAGP